MPNQKRSQYSGGPYGGMADELASRGRYGDSMMMHVSPSEVAALDSMVPGGLPRNPETGQPEAFLFTLLGTLLTKAAGGIASLGAAGTAGGALSTAAAAIPKVLGGTLTGFGKALGAAGVPTAGTLPAGLAKAFPALAKASATANPVLQGLGQVGSGLGQVAGLPVEVAGKVLGTHQGGGWLGEFFGGSGGGGGGGGGGPNVGPQPTAPPQVAPANAPDYLSEIQEAMSAPPEPNMTQVPDVSPDRLLSDPAPNMTGLDGSPQYGGPPPSPVDPAPLSHADRMRGYLKELGYSTDYAPGNEPIVDDLGTAEKLALAYGGMSLLEQMTGDDDLGGYGNPESSYEGPSSWSGREYVPGGFGGGRSGEKSYYKKRVG